MVASALGRLTDELVEPPTYRSRQGEPCHYGAITAGRRLTVVAALGLLGCVYTIRSLHAPQYWRGVAASTGWRPRRSPHSIAPLIKNPAASAAGCRRQRISSEIVCSLSSPLRWRFEETTW